jgi:RHS repeat-associated protein
MSMAAQLSENSRQGFDGIKAALCLGSMEAKSNAASGMPVCLWRKGIGSRSSGKERDAETGLDYFGARYFSSPQGRFTSPDPLLNSGRLEIPQSWNRYAYTLNNPLRYVDPDGLYEWSVSCDEKKDSACHQNRQWFRDALTNMNKALETAKKKDPNSQEYKDLLRVSLLYGKENDPTGIKVAFSGKEGAAYSTPDTATFDVRTLTDNANAWSKATNGAVDPSVEFAAEVAHEGSNVFDRIGRTGRPDYPRIFQDEINAYRTQSDVNYIFNTQSVYGLWNPSWAKVDKATAASQRNEAIRGWAQKSADRTFKITR